MVQVCFGINKLNMKYVYMRYEIYEIVHVFDEQTDQFFTVYSL
jgi:hypothetical protein